jgi:hypothetical protein
MAMYRHTSARGIIRKCVSRQLRGRLFDRLVERLEELGNYIWYEKRTLHIPVRCP